MKRILILLLLLTLAAGCISDPKAGTESPTGQEKPPALTVQAGAAETEAVLSTWSWDWPNPDGTRTGVEADGLHPLDMLDHMTPLPLGSERTLTLRFDLGAATLDHLTLRRWDLSCAGDAAKYESDFETLPFVEDGGTIIVDLPDGRGGIFEVHAYFTGESRGDGWYAFCLEGSPDASEAISFESQPVRIAWREGLGEEPEAQVIRSREALLAAVQGEAGYESAADLLDEMIATYGEGYFAQGELILLRIESGSGSIRFKVTGVQRTPEGVTVTVRRDVPEACTADMAAWLIFISVPGGTAGAAPVTMTVE